MFNVEEYTNYRKNFEFEMAELREEDDCIYWGDCLIEDVDKKYGEGDFFINIGYNFKIASLEFCLIYIPWNLCLGESLLKVLKGFCKELNIKT